MASSRHDASMSHLKEHSNGNYNDACYNTTLLQEPIVAKDVNHLNDLIAAAMILNGPSVDLNQIDVSGITYMDGLFSMSTFTGDISRWDVSNVTSMADMFRDCPFNGDISNWNTSKVKSMSRMFEASIFTADISSWNTARVELFNGMFACGAFSGDISKWIFNPLGLGRMFHMFSDAQVEKLQVPNVYCWAYAIKSPNIFPLPLQWKEHLDAVFPTLSSFGLSVLDTAKLVHNRWLERDVAFDAWALPSLD